MARCLVNTCNTLHAMIRYIGKPRKTWSVTNHCILRVYCMSVMKVLNSSETSPNVIQVAPAVEEIFQRLVTGTKAIQGKQWEIVCIEKPPILHNIAQPCRIHTCLQENTRSTRRTCDRPQQIQSKPSEHRLLCTELCRIVDFRVE